MTSLPSIIPNLSTHLQGLSSLASVVGAAGLNPSEKQSFDHAPCPKATLFIRRLHAEESPQLAVFQQYFTWNIGVLLAVISPDHWGNSAMADASIEKIQAEIIQHLTGYSPHERISPLEFQESQYQPSPAPRVHYLMQFQCSAVWTLNKNI